MEPISIICIDDNDGILKALKLVFDRSENFQLFGQATTGHEGIALAARTQPQIALVDIQMDKISGIEVASQIRQLSPNTKIVGFTCYHYKNMVAKMLQAGAKMVLSKATSISDLTNALMQVNVINR